MRQKWEKLGKNGKNGKKFGEGEKEAKKKSCDKQISNTKTKNR
jgi:hypothetical protein